MGRLRVEITKNRVVFVYSSYLEAEAAYERMKYLNPAICSMDGHLNAVVVDMEKVQIMGEG